MVGGSVRRRSVSLKVWTLSRSATVTIVRRVIAGLMAVGVLRALVPVAEASDFGELERRGCCSHHNGVCGCEGGRAKCCDGQLSPTCGCD